MKFNILQSKKKLTIIIIISLIIILGVGIKINFSKKNNTVSYTDAYEINGTEALKFNGISIVKDEEKILLDTSKGELYEINVKDGQSVNIGDTLFSYKNTSISDQIDQYKRKIDGNNKKIQKINENINKLNEDINKLNTQLNNVISNLNNINDMISKDKENNELIYEKEISENEKIQIYEEIKTLQSQIDTLNVEISTYQDTNSEMVTEKTILEEKVISKILAQVNGTVYINEQALKDPTEVYMNVVSNDTIVRAVVSEYDISNLKTNDEVVIKILSNGEYVKGIITEIEERPTNELEKATTEYNFYIKPEKNIKVGFNLEIKWNYKSIEIPAEYIHNKDNEVYVLKEVLNSYEEIKIKTIFEDNKYYLLDGSLGIGDKIIKNINNTLGE